MKKVVKTMKCLRKFVPVPVTVYFVIERGSILYVKLTVLIRTH